MVTTRITCKCKTQKMDLPCHEVLKLRSFRKAVDNVLLDCEEQCFEKKANKDAAKELQKEQKLRDVQAKERAIEEANAAARSRRATGKDVFSPIGNNSQAPSSSSTPVTTSAPFKPRASCKLSKRTKTLLYMGLVVLFMVFIGILIYLDKAKSMPSRRSW